MLVYINNEMIIMTVIMITFVIISMMIKSLTINYQKKKKDKFVIIIDFVIGLILI